MRGYTFHGHVILMVLMFLSLYFQSFYIRCTKDGEPTFTCQCNGNCDIVKQGRIRCQYCRYQRCLLAGMCRKGENTNARLFLAHLYECTGRAIAVTPASALLKMLKFLVKVFMSLYLLKLWLDQVDTLHVGRYWSEVLCCTIMTHLGDLEVKVMDSEILC